MTTKFLDLICRAFLGDEGTTESLEQRVKNLAETATRIEVAKRVG